MSGGNPLKSLGFSPIIHHSYPLTHCTIHAIPDRSSGTPLAYKVTVVNDA